ncbi:hypothetical protein B0H13DRAFT_1879617 [Mycena leptocephala]|nr:hypothetical protein B0H13DRAFT_1879617 [Mycena leptocephala]
MCSEYGGFLYSEWAGYGDPNARITRRRERGLTRERMSFDALASGYGDPNARITRRRERGSTREQLSFDTLASLSFYTRSGQRYGDPNARITRRRERGSTREQTSFDALASLSFYTRSGQRGFRPRSLSIKYQPYERDGIAKQLLCSKSHYPKPQSEWPGWVSAPIHRTYVARHSGTGSIRRQRHLMQPRYLSVLTPEAAKFNQSIGAYVRFDDEPFLDTTNYMLLQNPDGAGSWILAFVHSL